VQIRPPLGARRDQLLGTGSGRSFLGLRGKGVRFNEISVRAWIQGPQPMVWRNMRRWAGRWLVGFADLSLAMGDFPPVEATRMGVLRTRHSHQRLFKWIRWSPITTCLTLLPVNLMIPPKALRPNSFSDKLSGGQARYFHAEIEDHFFWGPPTLDLVE